MTGEHRTDRDLLVAIRTGDRGAGEMLARRHPHWAVDYAEGRGAGDLAEDVAHEVLGGLITLPTVELKRASVRPYLKACIVRRVSLLSVDRNRAHYSLVSQIDPATSPSSLAARHQSLEAVAAQLQELETGKRELLLLRYRDDLEPYEIAEVTGRPAGSVRKDLSRLRTWLSKKIRH